MRIKSNTTIMNFINKQNRRDIIILFAVLILFVAGSPRESFATKIAMVQYEVKDPDKVGGDAMQVEQYIREAASNGAQLIVVPETCFYRYEPWEQNGVTMLDLAGNYEALKNRFSNLANEYGTTFT
mgnify:CR=1 FL=1